MISFVLRICIVFGVVMHGEQSLRQQLEHEQNKKGLMLAAVNQQVKTIDFVNRSFHLSDLKISMHGKIGEGSLSRDGTEAAVAVSLTNPYKKYLGVVTLQDKSLREFPNINSPNDICWSNDKSKLALNAAVRREIHGELLIFDLKSTTTRELEPGGNVTSQCWSPDDTQLVYAVGNSIRIYDLAKQTSRELAKGEYPTWSPDGHAIAFYDRGAYYSVDPSGKNSKQLFVQKNGRSGLWWSPDGTLVAYLSRGGKYDPHRDFDFPPRQLRVRRLTDNSDDWFLMEPDVPYVENYQWVTLVGMTR